jgi:hypothetical protein
MWDNPSYPGSWFRPKFSGWPPVADFHIYYGEGARCIRRLLKPQFPAGFSIADVEATFVTTTSARYFWVYFRHLQRPPHWRYECVQNVIDKILAKCGSRRWDALQEF